MHNDDISMTQLIQFRRSQKKIEKLGHIAQISLFGFLRFTASKFKGFWCVLVDSVLHLELTVYKSNYHYMLGQVYSTTAGMTMASIVLSG